MGSVSHFFALLVSVLCVLLSAFLFFFGCIHWHNWWSLFCLPVLAFAFIVPSCCYNYNDVNDIALQDHHMRPNTFQNCRMLGWIIAGSLVLLTYIIPVLAWYNDDYSWRGVWTIFGSITSLMTSYIVILSVFVFG
jgi:glucan phosphoethanolaminetransferase (alkaline phosphatase superfamily)